MNYYYYFDGVGWSCFEAESIEAAQSYARSRWGEDAWVYTRYEYCEIVDRD